MPRASPSAHAPSCAEEGIKPSHRPTTGIGVPPGISHWGRVALSALARLLLSRLVPVWSTGLAAYTKCRSCPPFALRLGRVFGWSHIWPKTLFHHCPLGAQHRIAASRTSSFVRGVDSLRALARRTRLYLRTATRFVDSPPRLLCRQLTSWGHAGRYRARRASTSLLSVAGTHFHVSRRGESNSAGQHAGLPPGGTVPARLPICPCRPRLAQVMSRAH